jgi:hypothetical protein
MRPTRADLDQALPRAQIDVAQDALDHGPIVQEVQAELLPGTLTQDRWLLDVRFAVRDKKVGPQVLMAAWGRL